MSLPLDPHAEIINSKFPKYIPIEETECQAFNEKGVLFKEPHQNNYCFLRLRPDGFFELSLFKSDQSKFEKIEGDYLYNAITFKIKNELQTKTIIDALF